MRNFPESEPDTDQGTLRTDFKAFANSRLDIAEAELNSGVVSVKRIGQPRKERCRLLIVTCSNMGFKKSILRNAFKLREYTTAAGQKVFISPDKTSLQLQDDKALMDEAKRRGDHGERVYIRRGQIVCSRPNSSVRSETPSARRD